MPEDKDFKRIVRARMARTGERYTQARSKLRRDAAEADGSGARGGAEPAFPAPLLPLTPDEVVAWGKPHHRHFPGPDRITTFGPRWELTIQLGGPLRVLDPPTVNVEDVAVLGRQIGGVSFVAFGLDLVLPAPEGAVPESHSPQPGQLERLNAMKQAQDQLHRRLDEDFAIRLPPEHDSRVRRSYSAGRALEKDGAQGIPCRTRTLVYLGVGLDGVLGHQLSPPSWLEASGPALPGSPWASYGLVVAVEASFETVDVPMQPEANTRTTARPFIPTDFWDAAGAAVRSYARSLGLPPWPLLDGSLHDPSTGIRMARLWQHW